ncbi:hypothetical protein WDW37_17150 [Bdellovibrionota bacterium FG-1]
MSKFVVTGLVLALTSTGVAGAEEGNWNFSAQFKSDYVSAVLEAKREAESGSSSLKKKAKPLCPDLNLLLKDSKQPVQDLVPIEAAICKDALEAQNIPCVCGGFTGIGAARALLRSKLNEVCKWKAKVQG